MLYDDTYVERICNRQEAPSRRLFRCFMLYRIRIHKWEWDVHNNIQNQMINVKEPVMEKITEWKQVLSMYVYTYNEETVQYKP